MRIALSVLGLVLCLGVSSSWAEDAPKPVSDKERDAAIDKALAYLDKEVLKLHDVHGTPRKQFTVAAYGVVKLLARDARGVKTERRGGEDLRKIVDYLERYVDEVAERLEDQSQLPSEHGRAISGGVIQYNWSLAVAAMFFAELSAHGLDGRRGLTVNRKIVKILLDSQQENGGWGHGRVREMMQASGLDKELKEKLEKELEEKLGRKVKVPSGGYPSTLVASTNLVALALGTVKAQYGTEAFGEELEPALERALDYFDEAQLASGLFPYDPSQRSAGGDKTGIPRSGGAIAALLALGAKPTIKEVRRAGDTVDDGIEYLSEGHGSSALGLWLSAQGMDLRGDEAWGRFKSAFFRKIVDAQDQNGGFRCICEGKAFGATNDDGADEMMGAPKFLARSTRTYVTALHTWILLLDRVSPRIVGKIPGLEPRTPRAVTPR